MTDLLPLIGANATGILAVGALLWYRVGKVEKLAESTNEKLTRMNGRRIDTMEKEIEGLREMRHAIENAHTVGLGWKALYDATTGKEAQ